MADISFSLADLFQQAFGYKTTAFEPEFKAVLGDKALSRTEQGQYGAAYYALDAAGREYFMPVTLTYPDNTQQGSGLTGGNTATSMKSWELPYPVITVSGRKTVVETFLTERRGTVKELISVQDYDIVIKGFMIAGTNDFPERDVAALRSIYEINRAISIKSAVTDLFLLRPDRSGSDQVVIKELKLPALNGVKHIRPYELHLVSDEPFNLVSITSNS